MNLEINVEVPNLKTFFEQFSGSMHLILTAFSQNLDYYTNMLRAPYLPSPYLPAESPEIFVGEEGREVGI